MNGAAAQHEDLCFRFVEEAVIGARGNAQRTRISAESRHDEAALVGDETFRMGAATAADDRGTRMKVAGDFNAAMGHGRRDVSEDDWTQCEFCDGLATQVLRWIGIVIATDPDCLDSARNCPQLGAGFFIKDRMGIRCMKAVAQQHKTLSCSFGEEIFQFEECCLRIKRRNMKAAPREAHALFQMEVRNNEGLFLQPVESAR